ncbi:acyl carrier protein [Sphingomonas canadensis]|nr:acyl carrier protein [Sphingomonas canadensis]
MPASQAVQAAPQTAPAEGDIKRKLIELIVAQLGVDEKEVHNQASLMNDLGADSLDMVEITMAVEEAFNIAIPDDQAERLLTVGDWVYYVTRNAR